MTQANSINASTAGIVTNTGTGFTGSTVTQHGVLIGAASNAVASTSVGATGTVLIGNTGADPTFSATPTVTSITFGGGSALSTYTTGGTFTPAITFGGGSTGIAYTTQTGTYSRIGNIVVLSIVIVLSNKGSSTGSVAITGLPVSAANATPVAIRLNTITYIGPFLQAWLSGTTVLMSQLATTGTETQLADTNFTNTSLIEITGIYLA